MSIVDKVTQTNAAIQAFVQAGLDTVGAYHQAAILVPVDLARSLGLEKAKADLIRDTHQRMVTNLYGAVGSVNRQLGDLLVGQVRETEGLVASLTGAGPTQAAAEKPVVRKKAAAKKSAVKKASKKPGKKTAKKTSKKAKKKVAKKK
ncbi:MAG: hypothetical protein ACN4GT_02975 [Gammaproteobacteria bacterium]